MRGTALIIVGLILSSSVAVVGLKDEDRIRIASLSLSFQEPCVVDDGSYATVLMEGAPACFYQGGKPVLPMYTTTLELPFGSAIQDVTCQVDEVKTIVLSKKITPAPYPWTADSLPEGTHVSLDEEIYGSEELYPAQWMTYSLGGGLNDQNEHVTFCTLRVFPVRYSPGTDMLAYLDQCTVMVTYEPPMQSPFPSEVTFDLVIITLTQFVHPLQRLAEHKNNLSIRTQIMTLEEIYQDYPGVDKPEQIKYFIRDAIENWGTKYVLLVGGLKSHLAGKPRDDLNQGTRDWYFPVRYSNLMDATTLYDPGFISDLYYADIYDALGSFCSWDSCGDGVFGGWSNPSHLAPLDYPTDQIDFYPDVCLGRLPCRSLFEVNSMVDKIITYETTLADPSWFKKMVVIGGDPYDDQGTNYLEGELIGEKALSYMPGFEQRKLFASNRVTDPNLTPKTRNIIREINDGCGFLLLDGHGSPAWWNTYWPGEFTTHIINGGMSIYQFYRLHNNEQLPICILGGCHCNQFNVSLLATMTDLWNRRSMWSDGLPIAECFGWGLTKLSRGGAIATIGTTGLGYEAGGEVGDLDGDMLNEPDCVEALGGYLETQFFKAYGVNHTDVLGNTWCTAINKYLNIYPGMLNRDDAKTIEQWVLLGDPSLKIGGYSE
jgi:hypothetical protein